MDYYLPKIIVILRGYDIDSALAIAKELDQYESFAIEVTMNTPNALNIIQEIKKLQLKHVKVGAGTVLNLEQLKRACEAKAEFILSPILMTQEMINYCKQQGVISIPGAFSPNEIYQMYSYGADIIKVFPAHTLPKSYFKSLFGPLGKLPLMAVGGVSVDNAEDFFSAGCDFIGIGSNICSKADILNGNYENLRKNLKLLNEIAVRGDR